MKSRNPALRVAAVAVSLLFCIAGAVILTVALLSADKPEAYLPVWSRTAVSVLFLVTLATEIVLTVLEKPEAPVNVMSPVKRVLSGITAAVCLAFGVSAFLLPCMTVASRLASVFSGVFSVIGVCAFVMDARHPDRFDTLGALFLPSMSLGTVAFCMYEIFDITTPKNATVKSYAVAALLLLSLYLLADARRLLNRCKVRSFRVCSLIAAPTLGAIGIPLLICLPFRGIVSLSVPAILLMIVFFLSIYIRIFLTDFKPAIAEKEEADGEEGEA